ncbi:MAG: DoxX family protein [Nocardioidaceae bacterium]|nr:DoxX family protein [Nocardioidaceae bacterium]
MSTVVWILEVALALVFGLAGVIKVTLPTERVLENLPWAEEYAPNTVRLIGFLEIAGAVALVLPAAAVVVPVMVPFAAICLGIVMVLAAFVHLRRDEPAEMALNAVLLALLLVVAWARIGPYAL